ncbi:TPA: transcriptional regulator [Escherichia coli]|uniref:Transcriptional regulator n=1 Tax=Escherichia coli TaxID=562 RepID=A0ABC8E7T7_ECOLX|nr:MULTISPECIES: PapB/FocB family fimbrial expression transcriptional regulator [Escherichia]EFL9915058.1 transcriptional regulator [Escherichia coli]EFM0095951.1 transcriptional regulator [Escherichia coli]EHK1638752.1 transcriptional regulator [Escherichia coli]EHT4255972.1 transcriptional regulator [Escherichia coli]EII0647230.1 transcriptional regulator [Escherichia coli]
MRISLNEKIKGERFNTPGNMSREHFILLIELSPISSEKVRLALYDFFVDGVTRKEACTRHNVSQGYFSISVRKFIQVNDRVTKAVKYYLPKYLIV